MANNIIIKLGAKQSDPSLYGNGEGVLVLCNLANAPTVVNGGMYYNTTDIKGKICVNGTWQNIATESYVSGAFIQNQLGAPQTANYWINGRAFIGGSADINGAKLQVISSTTKAAYLETNIGGPVVTLRNTAASSSTYIQFLNTLGNEGFAVGFASATSQNFISGAYPIIFSTNSGTTAHATLSTSGNFLIGGTTDNGTDKLQVAGSLGFSVPSTVSNGTAVGPIRFNMAAGNHVDGMTWYEGGANVCSIFRESDGSTYYNGGSLWLRNPGKSIRPHCNDVTFWGTSSINNVFYLTFSNNGADPAAITGAMLAMGTRSLNNYAWLQSYTIPLAINPTGQNVLIGSTTDNGSSKLQVYGGSLALASNSSDYSVVNGSLFYRSDTNKGRICIAGVWKNIATEEDAVVTGRIIYVDKDAPNSTDTRTGISRFSRSIPFKTIQAAVNAAVNASPLLAETIEIIGASTAYTETVTISNKSLRMIYGDGVVHNAVGTASAIIHNGANDGALYIIMRAATINNTGDAGNPNTTACIQSTGNQYAQLHIIGEGNDGDFARKNGYNGNFIGNTGYALISSTNALCVNLTSYGAGSINNTFKNVNFYSANYSTLYLYVTGLTLDSIWVKSASTNASHFAVATDSHPGIGIGLFPVMRNCTFIGTNGVGLLNWNSTPTVIRGTMSNCIIKSYQREAMYGSLETVTDSVFVGYNEAVKLDSGVNPGHTIQFRRCAFYTENGAIVNNIRIPFTAPATGSGLLIVNCDYNKDILYTDAGLPAPVTVLGSNTQTHNQFKPVIYE